MKHPRRSTARSHLAGTLADEILGQSSEGAFAIASEHQLCRRFNISRVTVRLALSDLEARGLIFRKHGKGTFAYGRPNRPRRSIGVLIKSPRTLENWPLAEMVRGMESMMAPLHVNISLIQSAPEEWAPELIRDLSGVLVVPSDISWETVELLRTWKKPFLFSWETDLAGPKISFDQVNAARIETEKLLLLGHERLALLTGCEKSLDDLKRQGVQSALASVGKNPKELTEISIQDASSRQKCILALAKSDSHPTAIIACDDHLAVRFFHFLHQHSTLRIPTNISLMSFHKSPYYDLSELKLSTVEFKFFEAGQRAAEILQRAALAEGQLTDTTFAPSPLSGQTLHRRSASVTALQD